MSSERELRRAAWERNLEGGLREVVGGERAPDVTAAVLARRAAGEVVAGAEAPPPAAFRQRWLAAAVLLLGAAVVIATLVGGRGGERRPEPASGGPSRDAGVEVEVRKQQPTAIQGQSPDLPLVRPETRIGALPDGLEHVEARNLDDAGIAALIAHCPQLTVLRVVASTASRRADDPPEPVSISDEAFASIAKLGRLQRLELIGTDGVHGAGLRALDALPLLRELKLSGFDVDDGSLAVLPRLPSLQSLALVLNHGFGVAGIDAIAQCPGLRKLDLRCCSQLRADWIARLGALGSLVELDLSGVGSTWRVDSSRAAGVAAADEAARRRMRARVEVAAKNGSGLRTEAIAAWPKLQRIVLADNPGLGADVGQALRTKCPSLQFVDLSGCSEVDDTTVAELLGLPQLRTLDFAGCEKVTETCVPLLVAATQLRELRLHDCAWLTLERAEQLLASGKRVVNPRDDDSGYNRALQSLVQRYEARLAQPRYVLVREFDKLAALPPDVTHIELRGLGDDAALLLAKRQGLLGVGFVREPDGQALTDVGLRALAGIGSLQELTLIGEHPVTAKGCAELAELPLLTKLRVTVTALDDDALQVLPKLPALRWLWLEGVRSFSERGVQAIAACSGLRELKLRRCDQLQSAALGRLGALTALEVLDLTEVPHFDDDALLALRQLAHLRSLVLAGTPITSRGAAALAGMHDLRDLALDECKGLTDAALLEVPANVQKLGLGRCRGFGADAGPVLRDRFPGLVWLDVSGNEWVDDAALAAILELPKLEFLAIYDCGHTTAASLPRVLAAPSLLRLEAMRLSWLTQEAVAQLRAAKPNLQVKSFVW